VDTKIGFMNADLAIVDSEIGDRERAERGSWLRQ